MRTRLEATLTNELHRSLDTRAQAANQPSRRCRKSQCCSYTAARPNRADSTSRVSLPIVELATERNVSISHRFQVAQTVPGVQRAGHRPRIICEQVSGVKTVSYEDGPSASQSMPHLILASTSRYRRELLARLGLPFEARSPGTPEIAIEGEATRAHGRPAGRSRRPGASPPRSTIVIGSDQVASLDGRLLRKPGTADIAVAQLRACQGKTVVFDTAVAVVAHRYGGKTLEHVDRTEVRFRRLERRCARALRARSTTPRLRGQLQSRRARSGLVRARSSSQDPTALIGLPLIWSWRRRSGSWASIRCSA